MRTIAPLALAAVALTCVAACDWLANLPRPNGPAYSRTSCATNCGGDSYCQAYCVNSAGRVSGFGHQGN
jgi:hypothetical protein